MIRLAVVSLAFAVAACTDFATPAELTKPTILAITADPPIVAPGAEAALTTVVIDANGVMAGLTERHSLVETYPGVAPMGRVEMTEGGARYVAPDPVPPLPENVPPIDSVQIEIDTPDGATLTAIKVMPVAAVTASNPAIARLTVGGSDALAGPVTLARNAAVAIEVAIEPPAGEDARYAWYTSAGGIEKYQSSSAELVAAEDATQGWLFVAVRDGVGGVAWHGVEVTVEKACSPR